MSFPAPHRAPASGPPVSSWALALVAALVTLPARAAVECRPPADVEKARLVEVPFLMRSGEFSLSDDLRRAALIVFDDEGVLVEDDDGARHGPFAAVNHTFFDCRGLRLAFFANRGGTLEKRDRTSFDVQGGRWLGLVDGRAVTQGYAKVGTIQMTDSGTLVFFAAFDEQGKAWVELYSGGEHPRRLGPYDSVMPPELGDSDVIAWSYAEQGKHFVADSGGTKLGPFDALKGLELSDDGRTLVVLAEREDGIVLVRNGKETKVPFDVASELVLSPDGKRYAFRAKRGDALHVVVDGEAGPAFAGVGKPVFSADGKRVAYTAFAADGEASLVVDGVARPAAVARPDTPVFSPDGRRLAYRGMDEAGKFHVVVDGKAGPALELADTPRFSPDGRTVVFIEQEAPRRHFVHIGGRRLGPYEHLTPPAFDVSGRKVAFGALLDGSLWRRAIPLDDTDLEASIMAARVARDAGDLKGAVRALDAALSRAPDDVEARWRRSMMRFRQGDAAGALEDIERALARAPDDGVLLFQAAAIRAYQGEHQRAIELFGRALEKGKSPAHVHHERARAWAAMGTPEARVKAIADYTEATKQAPTWSEPLVMRGMQKFLLNDHRGALADFTRATELSPGYAVAWYNRGMVRLKLKDHAGCDDLSRAGELGYATAYEVIAKHCQGP